MEAKMGRPELYTDPEQFRTVAAAYFDKCKEEDRQPTVNGLCLALGMTRETLLRYAEKTKFSDTVNLIRMRLEEAWETRLAGPNATGVIFWLKNQGWSDMVKQEISGPNQGPIQHDVKVSPDEAYMRMLNG